MDKAFTSNTSVLRAEGIRNDWPWFGNRDSEIQRKESSIRWWRHVRVSVAQGPAAKTWEPSRPYCVLAHTSPRPRPSTGTAEFEKVRARAQALESGKSGVWSQPHNLLHQVTWPQPAWTADL